jgi:hypothetical protein
VPAVLDGENVCLVVMTNIGLVSKVIDTQSISGSVLFESGYINSKFRNFSDGFAAFKMLI